MAMTTLTATTSRQPTRTTAAGAALLTFGSVILAVFDFFVTTSDGKLVSAADYLYTLNMFPFLLGFVVLLTGLRSVQHGRDGTLGKIGFILTMVGVAGVAVDGVVTLITKNPQALGPAYPLGTLLSFVGMLLFAIASIRTRVLPWWVGPTLTVTWIIGGLVGDGGPLGFKGSALLLAATAIAAAAAAAAAGSRTNA
jgi:hypothetical protein